MIASLRAVLSCCARNVWYTASMCVCWLHVHLCSYLACTFVCTCTACACTVCACTACACAGQRVFVYLCLHVKMLFVFAARCMYVLACRQAFHCGLHCISFALCLHCTLQCTNSYNFNQICRNLCCFHYCRACISMCESIHWFCLCISFCEISRALHFIRMESHFM